MTTCCTSHTHTHDIDMHDTQTSTSYSDRTRVVYNGSFFVAKLLLGSNILDTKPSCFGEFKDGGHSMCCQLNFFEHVVGAPIRIILRPLAIVDIFGSKIRVKISILQILKTYSYDAKNSSRVKFKAFFFSEGRPTMMW